MEEQKEDVTPLFKYYQDLINTNFPSSSRKETFKKYGTCLSESLETLKALDENPEEHLKSISSILWGRIQAEQPKIIISARASCDKHFEEVKKNMKEYIEKNSKNLENSCDVDDFIKKYSNTVLSNFKEKISGDLGEETPEPLLLPYFESLKETIDDINHSLQEKIQTRVQPQLEDWNIKCSDYFQRLSLKTLLLFDNKILFLNPKEYKSFLLSILKVISFANNHFCSESQYSGINERLEILMSQSPFKEIDTKIFRETLNNKNNRLIRKTQFEEAALQLHLIEAILSDEALYFTVICLFLSLSPLYQISDPSLFCLSAPTPILRCQTWTLIHKINSIKPHSGLSSVLNVRLFMEFELIAVMFATELHSPKMSVGAMDYASYLQTKKKDSAFIEAVGKERFSRVVEGLSLLTIHNLAPERKSLHALICISGFLTEGIALPPGWGDLLDEDVYDEIYRVNWASKKTQHLLRAMKNYKEAAEQAKLAGMALAIALYTRFPFAFKSISLLGFSLGTKVIMRCVKELHKMGADHILCDVYLLAGAFVLFNKLF